MPMKTFIYKAKIVRTIETDVELDVVAENKEQADVIASDALKNGGSANVPYLINVSDNVLNTEIKTLYEVHE